MDTILNDVVAVKISNTLDWYRLTFDFDFVALHRLLDRGANIADADIDTRFL